MTKTMAKTIARLTRTFGDAGESCHGTLVVMVAVGVDEAIEDVPLGHLEPLGDGRNSGEGRGQTAHVLLHITQQLLKLVQDCNNNNK